MYTVTLLYTIFFINYAQSILFLFCFVEVNGDGRFQPILKSCALDEVPPNIILSFRNRILTVST